MARKALMKAQGPLVMDGPDGKKIAICRCGLSGGWQDEDPQPFCDGSHGKARQEDPDKVYEYDQEGNAIVVG